MFGSNTSRLCIKVIPIICLIFNIGTTTAAIVSSITLQQSSDFTLDVSINQNTEVAWFQMTGPDSAWFGVGFGSTTMTNTYAIIATGSATVQERKLGSHSSGSLLNSSISVISDLIIDNVRCTDIVYPFSFRCMVASMPHPIDRFKKLVSLKHAF